MRSAPTADLADIVRFLEGQGTDSYLMLGAHAVRPPNVSSNSLRAAEGVRFLVWAPHAKAVSLVGDFNDWNGDAHPMERLEDTGIWLAFVPGLGDGERYKYRIEGSDGSVKLKCDPYAFRSELRPRNASLVCTLPDYPWTDAAWQDRQREQPLYGRPVNIYEVHLGTWKRPGVERFWNFRKLADELADYASDMGYTHIELLPIAEHPFDRSWGYQITGFFSVTSRYGTPEDFMYFVDVCHARNLGVILDWVPAHFCKDDHGLRLFDGTPLYEYADPCMAERPQWGTLTFDYGKPEVRSFLISNALFWMDVYHIDGLRVDAVASLLHLNFDKPPEWRRTNTYGGEDNLEAIAFLKELNRAVFARYPNALMIAEDSSAWPLVTAPVHVGGLGFNYKWNMGWMNDLLRYMALDPIYRRYHHNLTTFSLMYAFSENFILPLSHDEVVHGKKSLLGKMPGDDWRKFAQLRLLYGCAMAHPGKKLLFMGGEFAHYDEWKDQDQLDWHLLRFDPHSAMHRYVRELNRLYLREPALWEQDFSPDGFRWIDPDNAGQSILSFIRIPRSETSPVLAVCNFTPVVYHHYRIGVPEAGCYAEILNSDRPEYGGSGQYNGAELLAEPVPCHGMPASIRITVPPLGTAWFQRCGEGKPDECRTKPQETANVRTKEESQA